MENCHLNRLKQILGTCYVKTSLTHICLYKKGKNPLKLWFLTIIYPSTRSFMMAQRPNKIAAEISDINKKNWFTRYPLPQQIMFDRSTKFMSEFAKMCQNEYGLFKKLISTRNSQSNLIVEQNY